MFDEPAKEMEAFSVVKRGKSFQYAIRGIYILIKTQHNMWLHLVAGAVAVFLGFFLRISEGEWLAIILAISLVILAEAFNTAIEFDIDLTSPEDHPFARDTKDVAAGAVLLSAIAAVVVGLVIFIPKFALFLY